MTVETRVLKSLEYFTGLGENEYEAIKQYVDEKKVSPDFTFIIEGEWSDYLYFLVEGLVKVFMAYPDGREQILHIASPYEPLNMVSTFDGGKNQANMLSMGTITLYAIQKDDLKIILKKYPVVSLNIIKSLASRIRHDSNLVAALSSGQVLNRLALLLMGKYAGESAGVSVSLTKEDMAGLIGTSREVVQRSLKILEQKGAIRLRPRRVEIIDKNRLLEITKTNTFVD
jgi:CRP/FNR family cyclic AMP-dependent transcriptional regulator